MYYATNYLIQATQRKIEPSGDCCVLYCCWFPPPPPTNRLLRLIRPLSIYPVGCCVCFPVMVAATIARDEWIYPLFFVELSILLGWLLCFFKHYSPPRALARIPIDCCVVCLVSRASIAPVLPVGDESSSRAIVRSLVAAPRCGCAKDWGTITTPTRRPVEDASIVVTVWFFGGEMVVYGGGRHGFEVDVMLSRIIGRKAS